MKKLLLSATLILGTILSTKAQVTIISQPFSATMPAGWSQQALASAPTNGGWQFSNAATPPGTFGADYMTQGSGNGYYAFVDDVDNNATAVANHDTLYTNVFSCSGYSHVFISFDIWYQGYYLRNTTDTEKVTVAVSNDGGHTWHTAITNPYGGWTTLVYDISAYAANQANVEVAFTYYDGGSQIVGMGLDNVTVYSPANYDVDVMSQNLPNLMQVGKPYTFSGVAFDSGGMAITSMDMNYSVNGGPVQTQTIASIAGFNALTTYGWSMPSVQFTPPAAGIYKVKYWASNLDGSNANVNKDTLEATFTAFDSLTTRAALYEEFTGQSCVFCMLAAPNMDSVYNNNASNSNIIRYHVPIPNRDYMYDANETPVYQRYFNYYSIGGAPWGDLDGAYVYPGADYGPPSQRYSSTTVQADDAIGSPIAIKITSAQYFSASDSFYVSANITALAPLPAGLTAQTALTIDSITYQYDLSTEDPTNTFAPPIGSGVNIGEGYPDAPDFYYQYVMKYTHVAEEMFPNNTGVGQSLGAFTAGQTQTISFGWKKNHPWSALDSRQAYRDSEYYDSSSTGQFVVFVQTNSGIAADGIPAKYIFQSASAPVTGIRSTLGVQQLSDAVSFEMYPNPTSNNTTLAFNLTKDQNVDIEVYNMLGDVVYSANQGMLSSGQHTVMINGSTLSNGIYMVRIITDGGATTQKLVIQK